MESDSEEQYLTPDFRHAVKTAIVTGKRIHFQTFVLSESGEAKLKHIIFSIIHKLDREDLMELIYTSAKELILNSIKAAIKRITLMEMGINPDDPNEYDHAMAKFKENLTDKKFPYFKEKMKAQGYYVSVIFSYNKNRIIMKIINHFPLLSREELRIREKFVNAKKYENLFEFYMDHGDNTEGAGMGITLVEIMMAQSGFDRRLFTIYTKHNPSSTIAKVEIPIGEGYKPSRIQFEEILKVKNIPKEDLRKEFRI